LNKRPNFLIYRIELEEGDPTKNILIKVYNSVYWDFFISLVTFVLTAAVVRDVQREELQGYAIYIGINVFLILE